MRVRENEEQQREGCPEPAYFDEVDVEDVAFLGEIGGCGVGREGLVRGGVEAVVDCWTEVAE